jgi:hypothetical protein
MANLTPAASTASDDWAAKLKDWWPVAALSAFAVALGAAFVFESRKQEKQFIGSLTGRPANAGQAAFERVVLQGVRDHELQVARRDMRGVPPYRKAFATAKLLEISPTELAVSGRFFGDEVSPIQIEIAEDGKMWLKSGWPAYSAAKDAGARAILADVVLHDRDGDVSMERRAAVNLL